MVDTETAARDSWVDIFQEYGCDFPHDAWAKVLGGSGRDFDACGYLAKRTGLQLDPEELRARKGRRKLELVAAQPLMPGIAAYRRLSRGGQTQQPEARRRVKLLARMGSGPPGPAGRHRFLRRHRDGGRCGACEARSRTLSAGAGAAWLGTARGRRLRGCAQWCPRRQTRR